ncbi:WD repeat and SOCS box-containing protein 1 isoform X2 [Oncorhynchus tshawytscha]|uniref:WD repeat and SOCS box-containing protein 1 isoform X2 n=1 Tax=Oncorhynchus tshawytscha TaxID=74940 RepID=UPI001C3D085A|nr:WD repeat and SOCS box-containing protein 1 isoform X2 [Oncorhynchus tshawytscha]
MASFPDSVNENEIGKAKFIGELLVPVAPFDQKSGRETWTVAFAPDGSYFAWSQGHRIVRLVPWSKCLKNFGGEGSNRAGTRRLSRQNSEGGTVVPVGEPREHTIDCGDIVWGLAFGSSVPEKQSRCVNIEWHRFKFGQDQLLLATGLNNGRIKIWDVYTGKLLLNLMDHTDIVRDLTFAPDGSLMLVSASRDKTLRVWDLKDDGNMVKVLRSHQNWVYCSAFSPDSSVLCSVGAGKTVAGVSVFEGRERRADIKQPVQAAGWWHQCHYYCRAGTHCAPAQGAALHLPDRKVSHTMSLRRLPPEVQVICNHSELKLKGETSGVTLCYLKLLLVLFSHFSDLNVSIKKTLIRY